MFGPGADGGDGGWVEAFLVGGGEVGVWEGACEFGAGDGGVVGRVFEERLKGGGFGVRGDCGSKGCGKEEGDEGYESEGEATHGGDLQKIDLID